MNFYLINKMIFFIRTPMQLAQAKLKILQRSSSTQKEMSQVKFRTCRPISSRNCSPKRNRLKL